MKMLAAAGVAAVAFAAALPRCSPSPPQAPFPSVSALVAGVPAEQRALAEDLADALTTVRSKITTTSPGTATAAVELLTANGNRGDALLRPDALASDRLMLDALQKLGVTAVSVDIPFPLLSPSYPRSSDYLAHYRGVAAEVRKRHMTLMVETQVVFTGTAFSPLQIDYGSMTDDQLLAGAPRKPRSSLGSCTLTCWRSSPRRALTRCSPATPTAWTASCGS